MIDLRWIRVGVLSYPDSDRPWDDDDDDDVLGWAGLSRVELGWPHAETYVYIMTSKAGRQAANTFLSLSLSRLYHQNYNYVFIYYWLRQAAKHVSFSSFSFCLKQVLKALFSFPPLHLHLHLLFLTSFSVMIINSQKYSRRRRRRPTIMGREMRMGLGLGLYGILLLKTALIVLIYSKRFF